MENPIYNSVFSAMTAMVNFSHDEMDPSFRFAYGTLYGIYISCRKLDMLEYWKDAKLKYGETIYGRKEETAKYWLRVEGNHA